MIDSLCLKVPTSLLMANLFKQLYTICADEREEEEEEEKTSCCGVTIPLLFALLSEKITTERIQKVISEYDNRETICILRGIANCNSL